MKKWKQVLPYPIGIDLKSRTVEVAINNNYLRFKAKSLQQKIATVSPYIKWTTATGTVILLFFTIPPLAFVMGILPLIFFFSFEIHIRFSSTLPAIRKTEDGNIILGLICRACEHLNEYDVSNDDTQPSHCEACDSELMEVASEPAIYEALIDRIEGDEELELEVVGFDSRQGGAFIKTPEGEMSRVTGSDTFSLEGIAYDEPNLDAPRILLSICDESRFDEIQNEGERINFDVILANETPQDDWGIGIVAPDDITGIFYGKELCQGYMNTVIEKEKFQVVFVNTSTEESSLGEATLSEIDIGKLKQLKTHSEYDWIPEDRKGISQLSSDK